MRHLSSTEEMKKYTDVQLIAKETMKFLGTFIKEGVSALEIKDAAETFMKDKGAGSFWYHGIGAFVLVGEQTTISVSGREYRPSNLKVKGDDLVTVDLSPEIDGFWGDLARSFVIQDGEIVEANQSISPEIAQGIELEVKLHENLVRLIGPDTTFEELYAKINSQIDEAGFMNIDFNMNIGHSIVKHIDERIYIESGNNARIKDVEMFTFEPHIKKKGGKYGFKHENIYYLDRGILREL